MYFRSMSSQWSALPTLLKRYLIFNSVVLFIILIVSWKAFLFIPLFYVPVVVVYHFWQKNYPDVDFEVIAETYILSNSIGTIIVAAVQYALLVIIGISCFGSKKFFELVQEAQDSNLTSYRDIQKLHVDKNSSFYVFLFLLSFLLAAGVEETLKYIMVSRAKGKINTKNYSVLDYQLYAITASFGFSTIENVGFQLVTGLNSASTVLDLFVVAMQRILFSIPIHCLCGYLLSLRVAQRDIFKQPLSLWDILKWSVFLHGNIDFWLLMIAMHYTSPASIGWNALVVICTAITTCIILRREREVVAHLQNAVSNKKFDSCWDKSPTEGR